MVSRKLCHWRNRHTDKPSNVICTPNFALMFQVIECSANIPASQRCWLCRIEGCNVGLGCLPKQDRLWAIAKHIADAHPGETPRTLYFKRIKGKKNEAGARCQCQQRAKEKNQRFKTHDVVQVVPPERRARGISGNLYLCKVCVTLRGRPSRSSRANRDCSKLKEDKSYNNIRRSWWNGVHRN